MNEQSEPGLESIGEMYDDIAELSEDMLGDSHHFGYFPDGAHQHSTMQEAADRMTDLAIEKLSLSPGQRVLDLGCGSGRPAVRLAEVAGVEVLGITVSAEQLRIARERAHTAGVTDRVRFDLVDAMSMPFDEATFDAILAIESLEHMSDQARVLRALADLLRPGGRVVVAQPVVHWTPDEGLTRLLQEHYRMYNLAEQPFVDEYLRMFARAGLRLRSFEDIHGCVMPPTLKLMNEWIEGNAARLAELGEYANMLVDMVEGMRTFAELPEAGFGIFVADKAGP